MGEAISKFRGNLYSAWQSQEQDVKVNGPTHPGLLEPMRGILRDLVKEFDALHLEDDVTIPMTLWCPNGHRHIDEAAFAKKPHHTHACQECGIVWRPAKVNTHGVRFLPGYKNEDF